MQPRPFPFCAPVLLGCASRWCASSPARSRKVVLCQADPSRSSGGGWSTTSHACGTMCHISLCLCVRFLGVVSLGFCDLAKLLSWARRGCFVSFVFFACCVATVSGCALPVCAGFGRRRACVRWWRCPCGAWGCVCECVCACVRVRACACVCVRVRAFACVCSSITSMASFFSRGVLIPRVPALFSATVPFATTANTLTTALTTVWCGYNYSTPTTTPLPRPRLPRLLRPPSLLLPTPGNYKFNCCLFSSRCYNYNGDQPRRRLLQQQQ